MLDQIQLALDKYQMGKRVPVCFNLRKLMGNTREVMWSDEEYGGELGNVMPVPDDWRYKKIPQEFWCERLVLVTQMTTWIKARERGEVAEGSCGNQLGQLRNDLAG